MGRDIEPVGIALIGSGFMGRAHALAFRAAAATFPLPRPIRLEILADRDEETAASSAASLGFQRSTGDWRRAVADPAVEMVAIATPNDLHAPIALAAMAAGKHVYCEKPLATSLADGRAIVDAAARTGVVNQVCFTYLHNPMIALARDIIASGEIGTVTGFRGIHAEDFMADPDAPWTWRCEPAKAGGALADIGSHIIAIALDLMGDIVEVSGQLQTANAHRHDPAIGQTRAILVDDRADAVLRFAGGAAGALTASWIASGRKMGLAFEIDGTKGALAFTQERFNELRLYQAGAGAGRDGFRTIEAGPAHPPYGRFCPAAGHQLGYNDLKTIEAAAMLDAIGGRPTTGKPLAFGLAVERVLDAVRSSHRLGRRLSL